MSSNKYDENHKAINPERWTVNLITWVATKYFLYTQAAENQCSFFSTRKKLGQQIQGQGADRIIHIFWKEVISPVKHKSLWQKAQKGGNHVWIKVGARLFFKNRNGHGQGHWVTVQDCARGVLGVIPSGGQGVKYLCRCHNLWPQGQLFTSQPIRIALPINLLMMVKSQLACFLMLLPIFIFSILSSFEIKLISSSIISNISFTSRVT